MRSDITSGFGGLLALILLAIPAHAQNPSFADQLIRTYAALESYCDSGTYLVAAGPPYGASPSKFEHCAHRDGRYKEVLELQNDWKNLNVMWSDGKRRFIFTGYQDHGLKAISYNETPVSERSNADIPPFVGRIFTWLQLTYEYDTTFRERLNSYVPRPELSEPGLVAFQATKPVEGSLHIIWLSTADGLIRRSALDRVGNGGIRITKLRVNGPTSDSDYWYKAPLRSRLVFAMLHHLVITAICMSVAAYLVGLMYWRLRLPLRGFADLRRLRAWMWRTFTIVAGIAGAIIIAVVGLSLLSRGSGDMPIAILTVPAAILCFFVMWLVACFLAARRAAERSVFAPRHQ